MPAGSSRPGNPKSHDSAQSVVPGDSARPVIGIPGLGRMGAAIATRFLDQGYQVAVWNRSSEKASRLHAQGALKADSPKDLADCSDVIITILTDAAAIDAIYRSKHGILSASLNGKLIIEMSTVLPRTEEQLGAEVLAAGAGFVDCPVGGTTVTALQGQLLAFAGGSPADFERAEATLRPLCRRIEYLGPIGSGASMKLAINLPLAVYWQALGEAIVLCRHLGITADHLVQLFGESSGGPNVLRARADTVAGSLRGEHNPEPPFDCDLIRKDLRLMIDEASMRHFSLPLAERTLAIYDQASASGWGERDAVELGAYWIERGPQGASEPIDE